MSAVAPPSRRCSPLPWRDSGSRRTRFAAGNDVGRNLGSLLRHYAAQIYGGDRRDRRPRLPHQPGYTDLAVFFVAAVLVGWLVFSPDQIADAARAIGQRVLP